MTANVSCLTSQWRQELRSKASLERCLWRRAVVRHMHCTSHFVKHIEADTFRVLSSVGLCRAAAWSLTGLTQPVCYPATPMITGRTRALWPRPLSPSLSTGSLWSSPSKSAMIRCVCTFFLFFFKSQFKPSNTLQRLTKLQQIKCRHYFKN